MFNIGAGEMIVIALILLMAVGPEQLPGLIRRVGRTVSEVKGMTEGLRSEFMSGLEEIERATDPEAWAAGNEPTKVKPRPGLADTDTDTDTPDSTESDSIESDSIAGDSDSADADSDPDDSDADGADLNSDHSAEDGDVDTDSPDPAFPDAETAADPDNTKSMVADFSVDTWVSEAPAADSSVNGAAADNLAPDDVPEGDKQDEAGEQV